MLFDNRYFLEDTVENCVNAAIFEGYIQHPEDINENSGIAFYRISDTPLTVTAFIPKPEFIIAE